MALKSNPPSELGRRLYALMEEQGLNSPKDLAKKLYALGLVEVKTRENDNLPEVDQNNAILSIEKKIVRHINSNKITDQQGDYLLAYCKFFNCSADYLLGLTPVRSADLEVRRICEILGLSESVVTSLMECLAQGREDISGCWSFLMDSPLLYSIPQDTITMGKELMLSMQAQGDLEVEKLKLETSVGPDRMDIQLDMEGYQERAESNRAAFYGMLAKVSRNVADTIEAHLLECYAPFQEQYTATRKKDLS